MRDTDYDWCEEKIWERAVGVCLPCVETGGGARFASSVMADLHKISEKFQLPTAKFCREKCVCSTSTYVYFLVDSERPTLKIDVVPPKKEFFATQVVDGRGRETDMGQFDNQCFLNFEKKKDY